MENILYKLKNLSNSWWLLPTWLQNTLQPLTKLTSSYSFVVYKDKSNYNWYFDVPYLLTFKESLCLGTEKVLDKWFVEITGKKVTSSSKLKCKLSSKPFKDYTTTLCFSGDDMYSPESSYYLDETLNQFCWFCPYLPWLFSGKPAKLYVKLTPV